jgi:NAD(P)-dependent dehydrogenase (short-subunit alcohol dehydrogenase family)
MMVFRVERLEASLTMAKYTGRTAVVTGGSTGIGFATAKLLADEGARVLITARSADTLETATRSLGEHCEGLVSDTTKPSDTLALAQKAAQFGKIDFLFVNAGIAKFLPFDQVSEDFYDEIMATNTKGAFFTVQKLAPYMHEGASVVFNTSIVNELGMESTSVYAASKAALRSLTRTLAAELMSKGVRVNAVSPGPIKTPLYGKLGLPKDAQAGLETELRDRNPMQRFGSAEEVAKAVLFLAFNATFTTGSELPVDGGLTQL